MRRARETALIFPQLISSAPNIRAACPKTFDVSVMEEFDILYAVATAHLVVRIFILRTGQESDLC